MKYNKIILKCKVLSYQLPPEGMLGIVEIARDQGPKGTVWKLMKSQIVYVRFSHKRNRPENLSLKFCRVWSRFFSILRIKYKISRSKRSVFFIEHRFDFIFIWYGFPPSIRIFFVIPTYFFFDFLHVKIPQWNRGQFFFKIVKLLTNCGRTAHRREFFIFRF